MASVTSSDGKQRRTQARRAIVATVVAVIALLACVPAALAQTYSDVPTGNWARAYINWVTDRGPAGDRLLDDFAGDSFRPEAILTRAQLARALVVASGHVNDGFEPRDIADVPADHPAYREIQIAVKLGWLTLFTDGFHPTAHVLSWQADRAVVRMLRTMNPSDDFSMLSSLSPTAWEPNAGWKTGAPKYFSSEVAARYLGLRYNHPTEQDGEEFSPNQGIERDEVAYIFYQALHVSAWRIDGLRAFNTVTLPKLTERQKAIVSYSFKYIGYPYIWAGEYPTTASPYGTQAHGGFDCSGFDFYIMKIHFGYPIAERTASAMAASARPRITRAKLVAGDLIFFGTKGPQSRLTDLYHAALYLGNGWFIHSTGSSDGVSLASINWDGWSWKTDFAWGRRVLKTGQFNPPSAPSSLGGPTSDELPTGISPPDPLPRESE
jgi:hypothetical protein